MIGTCHSGSRGEIMTNENDLDIFELDAELTYWDKSLSVGKYGEQIVHDWLTERDCVVSKHLDGKQKIDFDIITRKETLVTADVKTKVPFKKFPDYLGCDKNDFDHYVSTPDCFLFIVDKRNRCCWCARASFLKGLEIQMPKCNNANGIVNCVRIHKKYFKVLFHLTEKQVETLNKMTDNH